MQGQDWAYATGIIAVLLGAILVFFCFPRNDAEKRLLAEYQAADSRSAATTAPTPAADDAPVPNDDGRP